ncbi:cytochrome-c peroxidase [Dyadobacter tibetensis]|uniref:cytochrome-c peroxidase n=1 Tax=Dyadobacter tibetensis TaxID=1211851 RepID=UPI000A0021A0|nr:cytochrome c peroxidase [Dyadobacter tibetensis]
MILTNRIWLCLAIIVLDSCQPTPATVNDEKVVETLADLGALPLEAPDPTDNPRSPEKVELGRLLFFDPILSGNREVSCATCHLPEFNYAEFLETSIGVNGEGTGSKRRFRSPNTIPFVLRNSQAVLNAAFNGIQNNRQYRPEQAPMFWDNRARGLEEQALIPIKTLEEMRGHDFSEEEILDEVILRLKAIPTYQEMFERAFKEDSMPLSAQNVAKALASYERTLIAPNTRFDAYMRGDSLALSLSEKDGLQLFLKTGCAKCHSGPMFSDYKLHVLGVPDTPNRVRVDSGAEGKYAFRTPSLRNLRYTAPYMHSGKFARLEQVLMFYEDVAGGKVLHPRVVPGQIDTLATQMTVNFKDISRIVEFLNTLNDDKFDKRIPEEVPSGLPVKGI